MTDSEPPANLYEAFSADNHTPVPLPQDAPPLPVSRPADAFINTRLAVLTFIHKRMGELNMTPRSVAAALGYDSAVRITQLLRGRTLISRSNHFYQLCAVLQITPEERRAIQAAERTSGPAA